MYSTLASLSSTLGRLDSGSSSPSMSLLEASSSSVFSRDVSGGCSLFDLFLLDVVCCGEVAEAGAEREPKYMSQITGRPSQHYHRPCWYLLYSPR